MRAARARRLTGSMIVLSVLRYNDRVMKNTIHSLERQIAKVKRDIVALGDLQPGSLSTQYNVCGNPNCRCKATPPKKHGPYHQLSFTRKGRSGTRFIRPPNVRAVREQVRNYARLRELVDRLIDLSTELSILRLSTAVAE